MILLEIADAQLEADEVMRKYGNSYSTEASKAVDFKKRLEEMRSKMGALLKDHERMADCLESTYITDCMQQATCYANCTYRLAQLLAAVV